MISQNYLFPSPKVPLLLHLMQIYVRFRSCYNNMTLKFKKVKNYDKKKYEINDFWAFRVHHSYLCLLYII